MYYVYLLKSEIQDYIYIGSTPDLDRRMKIHNQGKVKSTKHYIPLKLIYYEAYSYKDDAITRERNLKHYGNSLSHLKKRLKYSLNA